MNSKKHSRLLLLGYRRPIEELEIRKYMMSKKRNSFGEYSRIISVLTLFGSVDIGPRSGQKTPSTAGKRRKKDDNN